MALRILIVEDDANINEVVCEYLKDSGYISLSAADGKTAMNFIKNEEPIDLFILDIMLPGISGLDLLKEIRGGGIYGDKPVIMLTALNDEYSQLISFDGLADDYVTKPFSPRVLVKHVQALLRRTGAASGLITAGGVTINTDSYEAYEDGIRLPLTLREYELLKTLAANQKKVLSRQQLLNIVWGYDYFGDERIVDVHIKNLRKKLNSNIILTIKGVGYKLVPEGEAE